MVRQLLSRVKTMTKKGVGGTYNALDQLRADHMHVERLLLRLRMLQDPDRRRNTLRELRSELDVHMRVEEELFYPACERIDKLQRNVERAYDEHAWAKDALMQLGSMDPASREFSKLVTRLTRKLEMHVYREENRLFKGFDKYLDERQRQRLDRDMLAAHEAYTSGRKAA